MAEITVAEALRVKNELAGLVSELQQKVAYASCGDTYEDGVLTSKKNAGSVTEVLPLLEKALSLSHAVHSTLARFNNAQTDLADSVRKLENVKVLQRTLSSILLKSEPLFFWPIRLSRRGSGVWCCSSLEIFNNIHILTVLNNKAIWYRELKVTS